jgi:hypothetical protein
MRRALPFACVTIDQPMKLELENAEESVACLSAVVPV